MTTVNPERRTAMYHPHLEMGAVMGDADGWQLPSHYGDAAREARWLREAVGVSDVSPIGKVRVVGADAAQAVAALVPSAMDQDTGSVLEGDSPLERGGRLLSVCLAPDEFLLLTPAGVAESAIRAMQSDDRNCAYAIDVTSGLCGVAIVGPETQGLMSRITEVDTSPRDPCPTCPAYNPASPTFKGCSCAATSTASPCTNSTRPGNTGNTCGMCLSKPPGSSAAAPQEPKRSLG